MSYRVLVDDNFHYMDEDERHILGEFESLESAIAACRTLVNDFLAAHYKQGMTAEGLYDLYVSFGDDPFVAGPGDERSFSAWDYAKERSREICQAQSTEGI